jgi:membrane fusion protein (multidrug efflux system)
VAAPRPSFRKRLTSDPRILATVAGVLILLAGVPFAVEWIKYRYSHSITNDAFVESHIVNIAPLVPGHIAQMLVEEHSTVQTGQLVAQLDYVPFLRQVELAKAKLSVAQASLAMEETALKRLTEEVPKRIAISEKEAAVAVAEERKAQHALELTQRDVAKGISEAQAVVEAAKAVLTQAEEDYKRYSKLYQEKSVPERKFEEATRVVKTARADLGVAQAKLAKAEAAKKQIDIAEQSLQATQQLIHKTTEGVKLAKTGNLQIEEAQRQVQVKAALVEESRRALDVAQTNLNYTQIVAPFDGVVVKRYRNLGDYVPVGSPIMSIYNPALVYVTANMEEYLLEGVAAGNEVRLDIDAFSKPFTGRVVWIGKATGANFALVPRDVTSGEFTKVVQRVPIRVLIDRDDRWPLLRPGFSVTVAIAHGAGDAEWARRAAEDELRIETGPAALPREFQP